MIKIGPMGGICRWGAEGAVFAEKRQIFSIDPLRHGLHWGRISTILKKKIKNTSKHMFWPQIGPRQFSNSNQIPSPINLLIKQMVPKTLNL